MACASVQVHLSSEGKRTMRGRETELISGFKIHKWWFQVICNYFSINQGSIYLSPRWWRRTPGEGRIRSSISPLAHTHFHWLGNPWTAPPHRRPDSIQRMCWKAHDSFSQFPGAGRFGSRVLLTPATSAPQKPQQNRAALSELCQSEMKAPYWRVSFCGPE